MASSSLNYLSCSSAYYDKSHFEHEYEYMIGRLQGELAERVISLIFTFPQFMYSTADSLKKKYTWSESSMELTKSGAEKRHSYSTDRAGKKGGNERGQETSAASFDRWNTSIVLLSLMMGEVYAALQQVVPLRIELLIRSRNPNIYIKLSKKWGFTLARERGNIYPQM